jgi:hypothetical protein
VCAPGEGRAALAAVPAAPPAGGARALEQLVDLTDPLLEDEHFLALLEEQVLPEALSAHHLERKPAQVADSLLAHTVQRTPLAT